MRILLALCVACLLAFSVCSISDAVNRRSMDNAEGKLLAAIANRNISKSKLVEAISKLKMPATECPRYWSRIANDPKYSRFHRGCAAFQLFKRHVFIGMRLSELARLLDHPAWLRASDIGVVKTVAGRIPVKWTFADTIFVIRIFPEARGNPSAVYLRVTGKVGVQSFRRLILGLGKTKIGNATVAEIGFSQSD